MNWEGRIWGFSCKLINDPDSIFPWWTLDFQMGCESYRFRRRAVSYNSANCSSTCLPEASRFFAPWYIASHAKWGNSVRLQFSTYHVSDSVFRVGTSKEMTKGDASDNRVSGLVNSVPAWPFEFEVSALRTNCCKFMQTTQCVHRIKTQLVSRCHSQMNFMLPTPKLMSYA